MAHVKNTAIKRIKADVREMMTDPSDQYYAAPLEDNMFDWHFTIRGPRGTSFGGGIYHGRILLPSDYPFKPPNIILLTPNGRFQVKQKICLSISAYHPEHWQPAWGIRLILEALISFMPTPGQGAIGALDYTDEERKKLAQESVDWVCSICGKAADLLPELKETITDEEEEETASKYSAQIAQMHLHGVAQTQEKEKKPDGNTETTDTTADEKSSGEEEQGEEGNGEENLEEKEGTTDESPRPSVEAPESISERPTVAEPPRAPVQQQQQPPAPVPNDTLFYFGVGLAVCIAALIYRKLLIVFGVMPEP